MYSKPFLESLGLDPSVYDPDSSPEGSAANKAGPASGAGSGNEDESSDPSLICAF
jgi:hypothetical protein